MQRFFDHIFAYHDSLLHIGSDEITKRLHMLLNNPQCGHKEGNKFPLFWWGNHQGNSSHMFTMLALHGRKKMSVLGLTMSFSPYLRSAKARFTLPKSRFPIFSQSIKWLKKPWEASYLECCSLIFLVVRQQVRYNNEAYWRERETYHINKFSTFYKGINREP